MISVEGLEVSYGRAKEPVLRGFNAIFNRKSLVLGQNGFGKTTLFRAVCELANLRRGQSPS
jgi:ABC-type cobalamin/Fe3+-siderophores transport system ATPase subunit